MTIYFRGSLSPDYFHLNMHGKISKFLSIQIYQAALVNYVTCSLMTPISSTVVSASPGSIPKNDPFLLSNRRQAVEKRFRGR